VIKKDQMFSPLLDACPSFRPVWEKFIGEWKEEKEGLPIYLALSEVAQHLILLLQRGKTESFPRIFQIVEQWHTEGDSYVKEAATVGLLEDLQNSNLHENTEPEQFRRFLGPESEKWWDKLNEFWEEGEPLRQ